MPAKRPTSADPPATQRSPRPYPHGSGDRNTLPSPDVADAPLHEGGRQRDPSPPRR